VGLVASNATALLYVQDVATGSNRLAGFTTNGLPATVNEVTAPELSGDGRQVAFETLDRRLVEDDFNLAADIFVFDLDAQTIELVSRRAAGRPARTLAPMSTAVPGGLSANGRFAAFLVYDTQQGEDTNEWQNIVVRDLITGASAFIGPGTNGTREPALSADGRYVAYNGGPWDRISWSDYSRRSVWRWDRQTGSHDAVAVLANKSARAPAISHDGNVVAFHTTATPADLGLTGLGDGNGGTDVFLRDMTRATHGLISVNRLGTATGNGLSEYPVFSPNGRWLVFRSAATDLTTNGLPGLFARDLWSNTTALVSFPPSALPLSAQPTGVVFSADSRFVAFANTNVVGLYDLQAGTGSIACADCRAPSLSADGRLLACELLPDPLVQPPAYRQILVKDLRTGATNLASVSWTNAATGGNAHSDAPSLSYDGRFVVFTSKASNLVPDDTNRVSDVFVRDLWLGTTLLVSQNRAGTGSGDAPSGRAIMAADGRTVLFQSFASDLVEGDFNDRRDIFVLRLGGPDTDGDGLDDVWEVAYFGDLSHDGTADTDHDGLTDSNEFQAGTDPTNSGSIFRAITVTSLGSGAKTILWSATPGRTYSVLYKDSVDDDQWTYLPTAPVTAAGTTGSAVDVWAGAAPQRFYRVVLVR
jgi:Tol biopolymer transport system component